jgi:hypothetical protein
MPTTPSTTCVDEPLPVAGAGACKRLVHRRDHAAVKLVDAWRVRYRIGFMDAPDYARQYGVRAELINKESK